MVNTREGLEIMRIADNTFAAACYGQNSIQELVRALADGPDGADMAAWNLTPTAWRDEVRIALEARLADHGIDLY